MSFDLYLKPASGTTVDLALTRDYFDSQPHFLFTNQGQTQLTYANPTTGVDARFVLNEGGDTDGKEVCSIHVELNYARPTFFAYEVMAVVEGLARTLDLTVHDPQTDRTMPAQGCAEFLIQSWSGVNEATVAFARNTGTILPFIDRQRATSEHAIPNVVVKFNRTVGTATCAICHEKIVLRAEPILVVEETGQSICRWHLGNSPEDAGYEESAMFQAASHWCAIYMRPPSERYLTLREALFRHPTTIFFLPGSTRGLPGALVVDWRMEDLTMPVVWIGDKLYRANDQRIEDQEPLFELGDTWLDDSSVAQTLQRAEYRGRTWMTMDGVQWTTEQLLQMLTTEQLATFVLRYPVRSDSDAGGPLYHVLVPHSRSAFVPEFVPLLIEVESDSDPSTAIASVAGLTDPASVVRHATDEERPFWPLDSVSGEW